MADRVAYKGLMLDGVPNFAFTFGYTNSSWTLKVGLVGDHFAGCSPTWTPTVTPSAAQRSAIHRWPRSRCSA